MDESDTGCRVAATAELEQAARDARWHGFSRALDDGLERLLDPRGRHSLRRLDADHGDRIRDGVPYYRALALLALEGEPEALQVVVDVPVVHWDRWPDAAAVIATLKRSITELGAVPVAEREEVA